MNINLKNKSISHAAPNALQGITLIERTDSTVHVLAGDNNQTKYERHGLDTRTMAWHETSPYYNTNPVIVSRTYTFNGKDAWDYVETRT